jgi:prepilin-type processing-associated H-X9-DG protein
MGATDGAFYQLGSEGVPFTAITDGLSNTLMVGEKHVARGLFGHGWLDSSLYNGNYTVSSTRAAGPDCPLARSQTAHEIGTSWVFGSYHPGLCQFVFCDGSVHALPVGIDTEVLGRLAARADGQPVGDF